MLRLSEVFLIPTVGATQETGETLNSCGWNDTSSVWFKYTPAANTTIDISSSGGWNYSLSVLTGTAHPLTQIYSMHTSHKVAIL